MVVEMCLIFFLKTFKIGQSQNDDLCGMPLCPVIDHPENSLNRSQGMLQVSIISNSCVHLWSINAIFIWLSQMIVNEIYLILVDY